MALTTVSGNSLVSSVLSTSAGTGVDPANAGEFNQVMSSLAQQPEDVSAAQKSAEGGLMGYSDAQINRYIDYQSTQMHPLFHVTFKDWWAQGGVTEPHQVPWIRETAANVLRATDSRAEFNASRGLPPPERPWEGDFMTAVMQKRADYDRMIAADLSSPVRTTVGAGADLSGGRNPFVSVSEGLSYSRAYSLAEVAEIRNLFSDHHSRPEQVAALMQSKTYSAADVALATRQTLDQVQGFLAQADLVRNRLAVAVTPAPLAPTPPQVSTPVEPAPLAQVQDATAPVGASEVPVAASVDVLVPVQDSPVSAQIDALAQQVQDLWQARAEPQVVRDFMDLHGLVIDDLARITGVEVSTLLAQWLTDTGA